VGYNALIAAGIAWLLAGTAVFFTSMQIGSVSQLRTELAKVGALKPPIPVIKYEPVPEASLTGLEKKILETYKGVNFVGSGASLTLSAADTDYFPQFLAAIGTLENGGRNWKVSIDSMCVGNDCTGSKLAAVLKVEVARVGEAPKEEEAAPDAGAAPALVAGEAKK
jgi:hypothetical protein